ncbi:MAG: nucleoside triphosphate pyrophosphohydrolase [Deltaproteobacteria bacterium]|nr:nucleoside triphosphate pyrophosphohydrolase [Deltaproteobacteria bacterium]
METLRAEGGCAWDRAQTLDSLKAYALEECYEVLDAIDSGDPKEHCEELGDLLLQVIFQAQIQREAGAFDAYEVCRKITHKMVRRHPHVFAGETADTAAGAHASWEKMKARERREDPAREQQSVLSGVPRAMPSLLRALRISEKASAQGFDWSTAHEVLPKIREEMGELEEALEARDEPMLRHEVGDLLFAVANLARHLDINPEEALRQANDRFTNRFQHVEQRVLEDGQKMTDLGLDTLEQRWEEAKVALAADEATRRSLHSDPDSA